MTAVALIGGDGAGKTTLAEALVERYPTPVKYLYMGTNASSSNISLPTTRLVYAIKVRKERRNRRTSGEAVPDQVVWTDIRGFNAPRGRLWAAARLVNRMAEEVTRQLVSWWYQIRGFLVVYDRHFLFEFTTGGEEDRRRLSERIHRIWLERLYPKPGLTILLDAPPEVLIARKAEVSKEYLTDRRQAVLGWGATMDQFYVIDATQPIDVVYDTAVEAIATYVDSRSQRREGILARMLGRG